MKTTANYGLKKPEGTDVVDVQNFNDNADIVDTELKKRVTTSDYTRQAAYAVDTGSANTYVVSLSPAPTAYVDGMAITVKIKTANTGASTLNVNSLGTKSILDSMGNALAAGKLKAGLPYTFRYNGTNFILQGEGGEYGTATPDYVANTVTFGTEQGVKQGAMNLKAENIREGITYGGIVGTLKEKQDLYPGVVNFASNQNTYKAVSYIKGEGLYCSESANKCYLFNNAGTLIKTITVSYNSYTLYPVSVTKNHILWTGQGTDGVLLSDKNGTTIVGESDSRLNGLIDEDNNKLYLENVLSGNCIIYCKDFNLNNLGEQTVVSGSAFGIIPMSTDILVLAKNSSNVVGLYYVNISSNVTIKLAYGDYAFNLLASI